MAAAPGAAADSGAGEQVRVARFDGLGAAEADGAAPPAPVARFDGAEGGLSDADSGRRGAGADPDEAAPPAAPEARFDHVGGPRGPEEAGPAVLVDELTAGSGSAAAPVAGLTAFDVGPAPAARTARLDGPIPAGRARRGGATARSGERGRGRSSPAAEPPGSAGTIAPQSRRGGRIARGPEAGGPETVGPHAVGSPVGGAEAGGAHVGGAHVGGTHAGGAEVGGAEVGGGEAGGAESGGAEVGGAEVDGPQIGGVEAGDAEAGGARGGGRRGRRGSDSEASERGRGSGGRRLPGQIDPDADPVAAAREICLRLLTDRARTRQELAQALRRKGVPDEAAHTVLERFDEVGLIDDAAFAGQWVRSRHNSRGLARRAIAMELRRKGVADEVASEALAEVDPESEDRRARELVDRKLRSLAVTSAEQRTVAARRLVGMLARKGYGAGTAYRVVREALAEHGAEAEELAASEPPEE